ncbi:CRAL-TRIO domain-containing protein [Mycena filopes]|nr:CRAL-TRIO domain-containing protein [Mycena filopes]
MSPETVYLPITPPTEPEPLPDVVLSEEQLKMQQEVQKHFESPSYAPEKPLMDAEKMWLSYECILRYLRASKWKVDVAITRLEATLKWRREYGIYDTITAELVEPESPRQVQVTVWMLERCIDMMPPGVESLALLINYADKAKNPSFSTSRTVLSILQDHYPERLGLALILNVPFLLNAFFKLITPFIDPITRQKMKFNPKVIEDGIFAPEMVMSQWWGGACNFGYDHDKYWPALVSLCNERTKIWTENWQKMGGKIGLKEEDYKRGAPEPAEAVASVSAPEVSES